MNFEHWKKAVAHFESQFGKQQLVEPISISDISLLLGYMEELSEDEADELNDDFSDFIDEDLEY